MSAVIDLSKKRNRIILALDIFLGTIFFGECWPMSNYFWRTQKLRWMNWINWIFSDPNHCREAYAAELNGTQNAPEYVENKR